MNRPYPLLLPFPLVVDFHDVDSFSSPGSRQRKVYLPRRDGIDSNFKSLCRFSRENVDYLANLFLDSNDETRGGALTNVQKMKCFLRYVGDPGFQVGVGEDLGVHQTTVCKNIWAVAQKIATKANEWIKFPQTVGDFEDQKRLWQQNYTFPSAIGAIDCTHVVIKRPVSYADEYVNRKGSTTFNIQATCNAAEWFTSVDCQWAGSVHDARIWRNSNISRLMAENPTGAILLGDEGYPLTPWVMVPYKKTINDQQKAFNIIHTRERVIIERAFGQLKQRFPILQSRVRLTTERVPVFVVACVTLHNVAKMLRDEDFPTQPMVIEELDRQNDVAPGEDNRILQRGKSRRDAIALSLL